MCKLIASISAHCVFTYFSVFAVEESFNYAYFNGHHAAEIIS